MPPTTYAYNARDQLTQSSQSRQTRTFEYDGHGRLWRKTTPEQGPTTYLYNADDTVQQVTDARGAAASYSYNSRHLPASINYTVPGGVAQTPNVTFTYDEAGNRTQMTDGLGSVAYTYDTLSRLTAEARTFTGLSGARTLNYTYNLGGQLSRSSNSWSAAQVAYAYNRAGELSAIQGTNTSGQPTYGGVSNYRHGMAYRAFGGLKQALSGDVRVLTLGYDNRLRLSSWQVSGAQSWTYHYDRFGENTGRVTYAVNNFDATLNRSYDYDHAGRLWEAHSGNEADAHAAGQGFGGTPNGPFSHSYRYDQHGNMTYRVGWGGWNGAYVDWTQSYTNNRRNGWAYDTAGNVTNDGGQTFTYDAAGRQATASSNGIQHHYDGDGLRGKKVEDGYTTYYLRSSVLGGQVIGELNASGGWSRGYVYAGWEQVAVQQSGFVYWTHTDPITKSQRVTFNSSTIASTVDMDPWGGETQRSSNQNLQPHRYATYERDANGSDYAQARQYHGYQMRFDQPDGGVRYFV